jgi:hypothetical protein
MKFRVAVNFVDDTYWDDGQRWTNRYHEVATLGEAVAMRRELVAAGRYQATSQVTGKTDWFSLHDETYVAVHMRVDGKWTRLEKQDIITLLGTVAGD